ncbi:MAG: LemA family protein [Elusimicrobia bacterium RIFOXYA2_FULL_39_19]|nr:MAG: LemA family protein [Elusimicrobia bacterium RIFOXYA2_FULL_39_19]
MKKGWIILGSVVAVIVIIAGMYVSYYNRFVSLDEGITGAWAQVENQYQRRLDLIPNLVNSVKGYAKHEKELFTNIADARAKLAGAKTTNDKAKATGELDGAISRLLMIAENYPQLKANENFIRLQDELAGTENRIAVERQRYNQLVQSYNVLVKSFPSKIVASMAGRTPKEAYFKSEEAAKTVPNVNF